MGGQAKSREAALAAFDELVKGQPHTFTGQRGEHVVTGLTMGQIYNVVREGTRRACGADSLEQIDLEGVDDVAIAQNTCCALEEQLGIYPNIG